MSGETGFLLAQSTLVQDGGWEDAASWDTTTAPLTSTDAAILTGGFDAELNSTVSILSLSISNAGAVIDGTGSLSLSGDSTAALTWSSGTIALTGGVTLGSGSTSSLSGSLLNLHTTLTNQGTVLQNNGTRISGTSLCTSAIVNEGTWQIVPAATNSGRMNSTLSFENKSVLSFTGALSTDAHTFEGGFTQTGPTASTLLQSGELRVTGDSSWMGSIFFAQADGSLVLSSGTHQFTGILLTGAAGTVKQTSGTTRWNTNNFGVSGELSGGRWELLGDFAISDANTSTVADFIWSGGTIAGTSIFTVNDGALMQISGQNYLDTTLVNHGTIQHQSAFDLEDNANAGGRIENKALFDATVTGNGGIDQSLSFDNADDATLQVTAGGTYDIEGSFENAGLVSVLGGTLQLSGSGTSSGTFDLANGTTLDLRGDGLIFDDAAFQGMGTVRFSSGQQKFNGTLESFSVLEGATLELTEDVTVDANNGQFFDDEEVHFLWTSGTIKGEGKLQIDAEAGLRLDGNTLLLDGTLHNLGTVFQVGSTRLNDNLNAGGTITNDGTWYIQTTGNVNIMEGSLSFTNTAEGSIILNTADTATLSAQFTQDGTLYVEAGTFALAGTGTGSGTFTTDAGANLVFKSTDFALNEAELDGAGTVKLESGLLSLETVSLESFFDLAGGSLELNNDLTVDATNPVLFDSRSVNFLWRDGATLKGDGRLIVETGAALQIDGSVTVLLDTTLLNRGTVYHVSTNGLNDTLNAGGIIENTGTWHALNTSTSVRSIEASLTFKNLAGAQFIHDSPGEYRLNGVFDNFGTLRLEQGKVRLNGVSQHTGLLELATGSTLELTSGKHTFNGATIDGEGTLLLTSGEAVFQTSTLDAFLEIVGGALTLDEDLSLTTNHAQLVDDDGYHLAVTAATTIGGDAKLIIPTGAAALFTTTNATVLLDTTLENFGSLDFKGGLSLNDNLNAGGKIINHGTWTFDVTGFRLVQGSLFTDNEATGVIQVTAEEELDWDATFNQKGLFQLLDGTVELSGDGISPGEFALSTGTLLKLTNTSQDFSNARFTGPGTLSLQSGTQIFNNTTVAPFLDLQNGILQLAGDFTASTENTSLVEDQAAYVHWQSTALNGPGAFIIPAEGLAVISGTPQTLNTTFRNQGTVYDRGRAMNDTLNAGGNVENEGLWIFDGALSRQIDSSIVWTNRSTGTFTVNSAASFEANGQFSNEGQVNVQQGSLLLDGGGTSPGLFDLSAGASLRFRASHDLTNASFSGDGRLLFLGGTYTLDGTTISTPMLVANNSILTLVSDLSYSSSATLEDDSTVSGHTDLSADLFLRSATIEGPGSLTLSPGTETVIGQGTIVLNTTLRNEGEVRQTGSTSIDPSTGGRIDNAGTWLAQSNHNSGLLSGLEFFNLAGDAAEDIPPGLFIVDVGASNAYRVTRSSSSAFGFHNAGLVEVRSGDFEILAEGVHPGTFAVAAGSQLVWDITSSGGTNDLQGATFEPLTTEGGLLLLDGGTHLASENTDFGLALLLDGATLELASNITWRNVNEVSDLNSVDVTIEDGIIRRHPDAASEVGVLIATDAIVELTGSFFLDTTFAISGQVVYRNNHVLRPTSGELGMFDILDGGSFIFNPTSDVSHNSSIDWRNAGTLALENTFTQTLRGIFNQTSTGTTTLTEGSALVLEAPQQIEGAVQVPTGARFALADGDSTVGANITGDGTLGILGGTHRFTGTGVTLDVDQISVSGGRMTLALGDTATPVTTQTHFLSLTNGELQLDSNLQVGLTEDETGQFSWSNGDLLGMGTLITEVDSEIIDNNSREIAVDWINRGTVTQSARTDLDVAAGELVQITNEGNWRVETDSIIADSDLTFINESTGIFTLNLVEANDDLTFEGPLENRGGTIRLEQGTLVLLQGTPLAGTIEWANAFTNLVLDDIFDLTSTTLTGDASGLLKLEENAVVTLEGLLRPGLSVEGGQLLLTTNDLSIQGGSLTASDFVWLDGQLGELNSETQPTLSFAEHSVNWVRGEMRIADTNLDNHGVFFLAEGGDLNLVTGSAPVQFRNRSTGSVLITPTTTNVTNLGAGINVLNEGSLNVEAGSGSVNFLGSYTHTDALTHLGSGFIAFAEASFQGGSLMVGRDADVTFQQATTLDNINLSGNGTIQGDVILINGSTIDPLSDLESAVVTTNAFTADEIELGDTADYYDYYTSAGSISFQNDLTLGADTTLFIDIFGSGLGEFDQLFVLETVTLDGSVLFFGTTDIWSSISPEDTLEFLQADTIMGEFANVEDGQRIEVFDFIDGENVIGRFDLTFTTSGAQLSNFEAIPEPRTYAMMGLGLLLIGGWWWRRRTRTHLTGSE